MIELAGVSKRFGDFVALHPTDLEFGQGKTTVLIGPSGCGKSTILRLIVGLLEPDSGEVHFDGAAVRKANLIGLRRRMGYVIQDGGLFPHLTGRQNVLLMGKHLQRSEEELEARLQELVDLTHFPREGLDRYPLEMSGGQRQRLSLMRALLLKPDVLLLDEPLAALDPMVRYSLQTDLKEIVAQLQQTVILVTHDMSEAAYLGDEIVFLMQGKVVQQGNVSDLLERPADERVTAFITAQRSPVTL